MPRNSELVRQWEILRAIDGARIGIPVARLAAERGVHVRTIRRDLDALCRAGFALDEEKVNGTSMWKLRARPFRGLEDAGLGLPELGALHFGRALLGALAGPAFEAEADRALQKMERTLPDPARRLAGDLPRVLRAKSSGRKHADERRTRELTARAFDAISRRRVVIMRYAVERIETLAIDDDRCEPRPLPAEPFPNSLGAFSGPAEEVAIEFDPRAAAWVRARQWHKSQEVEDRRDGSIVLRLTVSIDPPLLQWILGFGASARVVSPATLARRVADDLAAASARYREGRELAQTA